jgi:hypothetical protein
MAQFVSQRDVDFFDGLNSELIDSIIDTKINVFKVSLHDTEVNLYGESMSKVFFPGVTVGCLITPEDSAVEMAEYGSDIDQAASFAFHRKTLQTQNLYLEIGDVIEWNSGYYEVNNIVENQFISGQSTHSHSILCTTHLTRKSKLKLEQIRSGGTLANI